MSAFLDRLVSGRKVDLRISLILAAVLAILGCERPSSESSAIGTRASKSLRLATTTSTRDSGLLEILLPPFEQRRSCRVDVVAVGTGAALKLGESGDADVLLVHAPRAERAFMAGGHGIRRELFMFNYFTLLGPESDPARIRGSQVVDALRQIAAGKYRFVSRGDDSGTHKWELELWSEAGGRPSWEDYIESGQGMGPTLFMASEMRAYIVSDMGTYMSVKDKLQLIPLVAESDRMRNTYSVIVVDPGKHPNIDHDLATELADFLISEEAARLISGFRIAGQQLFVPTRGAP